MFLFQLNLDETCSSVPLVSATASIPFFPSFLKAVVSNFDIRAVHASERRVHEVNQLSVKCQVKDGETAADPLVCCIGAWVLMK